MATRRSDPPMDLIADAYRKRNDLQKRVLECSDPRERKRLREELALLDAQLKLFRERRS